MSRRLPHLTARDFVDAMPVHMSYSQTFAHAHAGRSLIGVAHGDYSTCSVCAPCTGWAHLDSRLLLARNALLDREFNSIDSFASAVTQFNLQRAVWISQECMSYLRKSHATVVEEVSSFVEHASTQDSNRTVAVWQGAIPLRLPLHGARSQFASSDRIRQSKRA